MQVILSPMNDLFLTAQVNGGQKRKAIPLREIKSSGDLLPSEYVDRGTVCLLASRINRGFVVVGRRNKYSSNPYDPRHLLEVGVEVDSVLDYAQTGNGIDGRGGKRGFCYVRMLVGDGASANLLGEGQVASREIFIPIQEEPRQYRGIQLAPRVEYAGSAPRRTENQVERRQRVPVFWKIRRHRRQSQTLNLLHALSHL